MRKPRRPSPLTDFTVGAGSLGLASYAATIDWTEARLCIYLAACASVAAFAVLLRWVERRLFK